MSAADREFLKTQLTAPQYEAVCSDARASLILAGAGSGKTRVLVYKIARLLVEAPPGPDGRPLDERGIAAVTFTNKAAGEMRSRICEYVGRDVRMPWMGTFHSICAKLLRMHLPAENGPAFRSRDFSICNDDDQAKIANALLKEASMETAGGGKRRLLAAISSWKSSFVPPARALADAVHPEQKAFAELYAKYERRLAESNALDFDDLLLHMVKLLENDPEVLGSVRRRFRHVLVDEYQDTNAVQYRLVRLFCGKEAFLTVVGDDDQSIYSWRGADIRNLRNFVRDFPDAEVFKLEENFRSTSNIVRGAGSVIRNNERVKGLEKKVFSNLEPGDPIRIVHRFDDNAQAEYVADWLRGKGEETWENTAVFYRTNSQSRALEKVFAQRRIRCRIVGGLGFYQRKEVRDVIAYLRLVANPDDVLALERIVNVPARGIGETSLGRLRERAKEAGIPLFRAMEAASEVLPPAAAAKVAAFVELIRGLRESAAANPLPVVVSDAIEKSGYRAALLAQATEEARDRIRNVSELLSEAEEREEDSPGTTLEQFLEDAVLATDVARASERGPAVSLMTLHSAKGLEFENVFVVGCSEGLLPMQFSGEAVDVEEERRLFYVGMTRARKRLWLLDAHLRSSAGTTGEVSPSRFLSEIDPSTCETERQGRWSFPGASAFPDEASSADGAFSGSPSSGARNRTASGFRPGFARRFSTATPQYRRPEFRGSAFRAGTAARPASVRPASELLGGEESQENLYLRVGAKVRHPRFGFGVVLAASGTSPTDRVDVRFADGSTRCLVIKFASLTVVG